MIQISQNGSKEIEFPHCDVVPRVLTEKDWLRFCLAKSVMPSRVHIQGVLFEIFRFQIDVALKQSTFDPMLVKPKCIWGAVVLF